MSFVICIFYRSSDSSVIMTVMLHIEVVKKLRLEPHFIMLYNNRPFLPRDSVKYVVSIVNTLAK